MTEERKAWYDAVQTIEMSPSEMTQRLFDATVRMCDMPNNAVAKRYFTEIGAASRDVFLSELVFALMTNPPTK